jgi:hypothetical protein
MTTTKVQSEFIAINAISGTIIADGAITSTHLAANSVDSSELVTGSIDTIHIAANQITATKIVTNGVLTRHISDDQITADKLANSINTDIAAKLPLAGGTMTGDLITTGLTVDTTTLVVDKTNNRVGIGITEPVGKLDIGGNTAGTVQAVLARGVDESGMKILVKNGDAGTVNTSQGSIGLDYADGTWANMSTIKFLRGDTSGQLAFYTSASGASGTERMRIDSSGNVGIGTDNPSTKLNVSDSSGTAYKALTVQSSNVNSDAGISLIGGGGSDFRLQQPYNSAGLFFYDVTNTAERMRIDSSGNVGIGVTPESWYTGGQMRALQVGGTTAVMSLFDTRSIFANNYYLKAGTGADTYINTDEATQYYQEAGNHIWKHATSGTADTTISWSESMRINASGTVLVGKPDTTLSVAGVFIGASGSVGATRASDDCLTLNRTGNDGAIASFYKNGAPIGNIGTFGGTTYYASNSHGFLINGTQIEPSNNTGGRLDNTVDIGSPTYRFKDLYLSGTMLGNITKLRQHTSSMYVSPTNTNTLNGNLDADNDGGDMWINYRGYQDGFSRFRDFRIGNGKGAELVLVDGSAASVAITGSLSVTSSFSKGSGSFKIDHPLEAKKDTHHLIHSFVEAPQADNIYRGKIDLVAGSATANIDTVAGMTEGTFVALNREVQCFTTNESNWDAVKGSVSGNILTIESENSESTATISWLVIGERKDQHMYDTDWTDDDGKVIVEPLKETLENA